MEHLALSCALVLLCGSLNAAEPLPRPELLVYYNANLLVDHLVDDLEKLLRRAATAGYTGAVLSDVKFARLGDMPPAYFRNLDRVKRIAAETGIEIIPTLFPIGYSEGLLAHDPNLAEGLPVHDAPFVVTGGAARPDPVAAPALRGGDPLDPTQWDSKDDLVVRDPDRGIRITDPDGHMARLRQQVQVHPWRQYHLTVQVKTRDFTGTPRVAVMSVRRSLELVNLGSRQSLNYADLDVKPTQDWTRHHVVFNSLDNDQVDIYLGSWNGRTGSLWWDQVRIEEAGLVNLVRRDGAPFTVTRADGTKLTEGTDYPPVADPRLGVVPWPGAYEVWHEPPLIRAALPDGTQLRVSFHHAITFHHGQVMACPSEPKTVALLRDEAQRVHAAWGARAYFMRHDEIRVLNQDEACRQRHLDAGAILADNAKTCVQLLREVNPGGRIYVWSDMFDPSHNAGKNYYLVRGDLAGSWEGLDKEVIIANWNQDQRDASLRWFAGRGHRILIAGYYDRPVAQIGDWLTSAARVGGAEGLMYTTWVPRYDDLEEFARLVSAER